MKTEVEILLASGVQGCETVVLGDVSVTLTAGPIGVLSAQADACSLNGLNWMLSVLFDAVSLVGKLPVVLDATRSLCVRT